MHQALSRSSRPRAAQSTPRIGPVAVLVGLLLSACAVGDTHSDYAPIPEPINALAATVLADHLYIHGGHSGGPHEHTEATTYDWFLRLDLSDPAADWEPLTDPGVGVQQGSLFAHDGAVHRLGGMTVVDVEGEESELYTLTDFQRWDEATDTWVDLPPMPDSRSSHGAVVMDGVVYVTGGWTLTGPQDSGIYSTTFMWADLNADPIEWHIEEQPFEIRDHCTEHADGKVWVFGGMKSGVFPRSVHIWDPVERAWSEGPKIPDLGGFQGFGCGSVTTDSIYFTADSKHLVRLDDDRQGWTKEKKVIEQRYFHRMAARNPGELLLVGGGKGISVTPIDSVESLLLP